MQKVSVQIKTTENKREGERGRNKILISSRTVGGYALIDLDELRMRWNPEKKMMKKVTSKLMKAGCAAYVPALLHTEHVHPVNKIRDYWQHRDRISD